MSKGYYVLDNNPKTPYKLNKLAREQLKYKLLQDLRIDFEICKLEGWDIKEYINELKTEIDNIYNKLC